MHILAFLIVAVVMVFHNEDDGLGQRGEGLAARILGLGNLLLRALLPGGAVRYAGAE